MRPWRIASRSSGRTFGITRSMVSLTKARATPIDEITSASLEISNDSFVTSDT